MKLFRLRRLPEYFRVDKELIIIFLLVAITAIIFFFVVNQRAFLNFFYIPVLLAAFFYGKRYATMAATFTSLLIFIVAYTYAFSFNYANTVMFRWLDLMTWGGFLIVTGYMMGLLYEKKEEAAEEIRDTYQGIIEMLSLVIDSVDKQTQSHSYRVSIISEMIAKEMGCSRQEVENIRIAALLHDLGKIGISSEVLKKVGKLSGEEREHLKKHPKYAVKVLEPVGGKVLELLPIILHHHEKYDGSGYHTVMTEDIPLGARIIAVADVYDALTSDRPYRKALSPFQAKKEIVDNAGSHFDPEVVKVFKSIFHNLGSEDPFIPGTSLA